MSEKVEDYLYLLAKYTATDYLDWELFDRLNMLWYTMTNDEQIEAEYYWNSNGEVP